MTLKELIKSGSAEMGITLDDGQLESFSRYYELLDMRSREFNLTAIKGQEDAAKLHFLDSLGILKAWDFKGKSVVDVGTGAGFPGLPLLIAERPVALTLVDSTEKKVDFLREVCENTGLSASCLHARAEELGQDPEYRQRFDIAVSRAVARLNVLAELCLPLVKPGGVFIAMKSADSDEEIAEADKAIAALGGEKAEIYEYGIPQTDIVRRAVIIKKSADTPEKYPRRYAKIQKSPL